MSEVNSLCIIGPGRVGTAIAFAAHKAGVEHIYIGGRSYEKVEAAARLVPGAKAWRMAEAARHAEVVFLAVSDNEIALVAKQLAEERAFASGAVVAHLSGALDSSVLSSAKTECGALIASAHPLNTFPSLEGAVAREPGTHWFLEGDSEAVDKLSVLVARFGDIPHAITSEGKAMYHAASVVACNYLASLMDTALEMMEQANVDRASAWTALKPLVFSTMENIDKMGPQAALTGPIARGDQGTVEKHMRALANSTPEQKRLYAALGLKTVALALSKGTIDEKTAKGLSEMLQQNY